MGDITAVLGRLVVLAFRDSATSSSHQVVIPASVQVGDLAIIFDHADTNFGPPAKVVPTGWTEVQDVVDLDIRHVTSYRIIEAGDASSTVTCMNGATADRKIMLVFSGLKNATIEFADLNIQLTQFNPTLQSCNASDSLSRHVIVLAATGNESGFGVGFDTESPALDAEIDAGLMIAGYKIYNTSPQDHTFDCGDDGQGNYLESFYVTVT